MIRKTLRFLAGALGFIALSACAGTGWFWWHTTRSDTDWLRISGHGAYFSFYSSAYQGISIFRVKGFPDLSPIRVRFSSGNISDNEDLIQFYLPDDAANWTEVHHFFRDDSCRSFILVDGTPASGREVDYGYGFACAIGSRASEREVVRELDRLSYSAVRWMPHRQIILVLAFPSLAWLMAVAMRIHGSFNRHRRHLRGRCLSCSYDLRGNISGICPDDQSPK